MDKEQYLEFISRMDTMKDIIKLNDPNKYEELSKMDKYWAPETRPLMYSEWVMNNYVFEIDDAFILCIYSLLLNVPIRELKERMHEESNFKVKKYKI